MTTRQPFARRIVIAFVLMTAVVSGAFSLSIVGVVHFVEAHLVSEEMRRELNAVLQEDIKQGHRPRLDSRTRFFASDLPEYAIPAPYAELEEGFTELVDGDDAHYVYTQQINGRRYLLVQDQHEFEAREHALFNIVLAGFLLTVAGAWMLGWIMARHVMVPISRLAQRVRDLDQSHPARSPLAADYADDEVGQLAAAFDNALGRLRQALERERLFTSDVSHELRTPLMVIGGACELLATAPLSERHREQLARIERASAEMQDLVRTFLQLARDTSNPADDDGAGLAEVAAEQASRWGQSFRDKGIAFECVEQARDRGHYNPTLLGVVMANLLRNALHYTERGSVRLVLESGGFRVEDSGIGIPVPDRATLFQPFVRGERARGEGLGLGLSLVKRICVRQGWTIAVHDLEPGGTRFEVSLAGSAQTPGGQVETIESIQKHA